MRARAPAAAAARGRTCCALVRRCGAARAPTRRALNKSAVLAVSRTLALPSRARPNARSTCVRAPLAQWRARWRARRPAAFTPRSKRPANTPLTNTPTDSPEITRALSPPCSCTEHAPRRPCCAQQRRRHCTCPCRHRRRYFSMSHNAKCAVHDVEHTTDDNPPLRVVLPRCVYSPPCTAHMRFHLNRISC